MRPWALPSTAFIPKRHSYGGLGPWSGHLPFAFDLITFLRPALVVELGTFFGESYFGFCQAIQEASIPATAYAVDTWMGDPHGGYYGEEIFESVRAYNSDNYPAFSHLLRMTFTEARSSFGKDSIDLLHIDGFHSYEAVRDDFEEWLPKVRPGGVVLFHDISTRGAEFGVWRLWDELRERFPSFSFTHSAGLGVLVKPDGDSLPQFLSALVTADPSGCAEIRRYYSTCADHIRQAFENEELRRRLARPSGTTLQVFYADGETYEERNSVARVIETGIWQRVTIDLPAGVGVRPLRLDPADRPSIIELSNIRIYTEDRSAILFNWQPPMPLPEVEAHGTARLLTMRRSDGGITLLSDGGDPQVYLCNLLGAGVESAQPIELEVALRVTECVEVHGQLVPLGSDAEEYIKYLELDRHFLRDEVRPELRSIQGTMAALNNSAEAKLHAIGSQFAALDQCIDAKLGSIHAAISDEAVALRAFGEVNQQLVVIYGDLRGSFNKVTEQMSTLSAEKSRLDQEFSAIQTKLERTTAELNESKKQVWAERSRREALEMSWSWRVTQPLRYLADLMHLNKFTGNRR